MRQTVQILTDQAWRQGFFEVPLSKHALARGKYLSLEEARKLSTSTQEGYLRACRRFAAFLKRSPDTASSEDIRRFQLHLARPLLCVCTGRTLRPCGGGCQGAGRQAPETMFARLLTSF